VIDFGRRCLSAIFVAIFWLASSQVFAQNRAQLFQLNNQNIYANGQGAITGPVLNGVLSQIIAGTGNQTDTNLWTGSNTFTGPFSAPGLSASSFGQALFAATNSLYGNCTWTSAGDVGPCINAAVAAAVSSPGGGTILLPSSVGAAGGCFGLATSIVQKTPSVNFLGQGVGIPRDNTQSSLYLGGTRLCWNGAAGATMYTEGPAGNTALYAASVEGIVFDCNNLAGIGFQVGTVDYSRFDVGAAECRSINALFTTSNITDQQSSQHNTVRVASRSTSSTYSPTGIMIDTPLGATGDWSRDQFTDVFAWYNLGDGVVVGNTDNNDFFSVTTFPQPGATGRSLAYASTGYTSPNGIATSGNGRSSVIFHNAAYVNVLGWRTGANLTANPSNSCNGAGASACGPTTVSIVTDGTTPVNRQTVPFVSTTGAAAGETLNCPLGDGVPIDAGIFSIGTGVQLNTFSTYTTVPSGITCSVSWGPTTKGATGTYTITAASATTVNITAPAGGNSQTGLSISSGTLTATDIVSPWFTTAMTAGDSWTVTFPTPANGLSVMWTDAGNSEPDPAVQNGVPIMQYGRTQSYGSKLFVGNSATQLIVFGGSGTSCAQVGGNNPVCGGTNTAAINATAGAVGSFGGMISGHNSTSAVGNGYGFIRGENGYGCGSLGEVFGEEGYDGCLYNKQVQGGGAANGQGSAQRTSGVLWASGAGGMTVRLTADGGAAGSANCWNLVSNYSSAEVHFDLLLQEQGAANAEGWPMWTFMISRGNGVTATVIPTNTTPTPYNSSVGGTPTLAADTTNSCANLSMVLPAGGTWTVTATPFDAEAK
jgi:hypothetical protein